MKKATDFTQIIAGETALIWIITNISGQEAAGGSTVAVVSAAGGWRWPRVMEA